MRTLWLVNQLWVIMLVDPRKNCASSLEEFVCGVLWRCNGEESCISLAVKFELISVKFTYMIIAVFRRISVEYM